MRMENLKAKEPDAKNIVKARITAYSKEDAEKAASLLAAGTWKHHTVKQIRPLSGPDRKQPENVVYYVLLWN